jgi:hypothetical protein
MRHPEIAIPRQPRRQRCSILGRVTKAMCRAGVEKAEIDTFMADAIAGNCDHLLCTCSGWWMFNERQASEARSAT